MSLTSTSFRGQPGAITWRKPDENDLAACLGVSPGNAGDEITGPDVAQHIWRLMLHHPAMVAAVIECDQPIHGQRIVGFGAAVFVTPEFADAELGNPRPGLNARIVAAMHSGQSVLQSQQAIARANAGSGLDLALLYGNWDEGTLHPEELADVQTQLGVSLAHLIGGYKISRIFVEPGGEQLRFIQKSDMREIAKYPELDRALMLATRADAMARPLSLSRGFFSWREPILGLSWAEQELLSMAQDGQTDLDLAASLRLTVPAVKARWRSALAKFAERAPDLAPEFSSTRGRGPQRRHRVLAWLRHHPEELRPFDPAGGQRAQNIRQL
jgi:hypothetical protein